jgi:hypothetical protein
MCVSGTAVEHYRKRVAKVEQNAIDLAAKGEPGRTTDSAAIWVSSRAATPILVE